jgi:methyl-accepting chemotaxis protein
MLAHSDTTATQRTHWSSAMRKIIENLSLSRKLMIAPALVMFFLIALGAVGFFTMKTEQRAMDEIFKVHYITRTTTDAAKEDLVDAHGNLYKMISWLRAGYAQERVDTLAKAQLVKADSAIANLRKVQSVCTDTALISVLGAAIQEAEGYHKAATTAVDLASFDANSATMAMGSVEDKFEELSHTLKHCDEIVETSADQAYSAATASYERSSSVFIAILLVALIASSLVTLWLTRMLTAPITVLQRVLSNVAAGNSKLTEASQAMAAGKTSMDVDVAREEVTIDQKDEIGALAESTRQIVNSQEQLLSAFSKVAETIRSLIEETGRLSKAAVQGQLSARGNASAFEGGYRELIQGVNNTLDAVIGPLNIAANYVNRISKGDIPAPITDTYHGDFNELKNNLNTCIDAIQTLVADTILLSDSAVHGRLSTRAEATKHQGDFRKIVEGINATLDSVIQPIEESARVLSKMAEGDLTARVTAEYHGDHRRIVESINAVAESLMRALIDVSEAVAATASASSQISSSTEEMAAGAQEQTSQTAEVAGAVEEMTKTILENSRNASMAAETAKQAKQSAEQGGKVVDESVNGMTRIAEVVNRSAATVKELGKSSDQIGEIISVIDDIADQTNLLALNAAIEAARAGDQGRGFAVVADEVRKLAERTTRATKEIAGMIRKIQSDTSGAVASMEEGTNEVTGGIALANRAGNSLREIVGVSQKLTDMVTQIAAASEEQSSASEEISRNVEAISKVSGESAVGTQQIARAAEDLNRLTENLQQLIARFTLAAESRQIGPRKAVLAARGTTAAHG